MRYATGIVMVSLNLVACRLQSWANTNHHEPRKKDSALLTVHHGSRMRKAEFYLPKNHTPEEKLPAVIALHGAPGYGANLAEFSGLREFAAQVGFIAVFPDGTSGQDPFFLNWNAGVCCGYATENNIDDLGFLRRLIQILIADYAADETRIYMTGFSKGGMMAYYFACRHAELLSGIAIVAGAFNLSECDPARSLDVLIVHGLHDQAIAYGGNTAESILPFKQFEDRPVAYAVQFWRRVNHCHPYRSKKTTQLEILDFACFRSSLRLITLLNEGHIWPGARPGLLGAAAQLGNFSVNQAMWDFWQESE